MPGLCLRIKIRDTATPIAWAQVVPSAAPAGPHPPENGADNIVGGDKGDAEKADGEVRHCALHCCLRGGHHGNNGTACHQQDAGQHHGQAHKEGDGVADIGCRLFFLSGTHCLSDADGGSHGKSHNHHGEHVHHLGADGHRSGAGHPVKLSDDKQIRHSV